MYYILYFLSGMFAGNGVPHFVKGITGQEFRTPFGRFSSPAANVTWGTINFIVAWLIWHFSGTNRPLDHTIRYEIAFGVGVYVIAMFLAINWARGTAAKK